MKSQFLPDVWYQDQLLTASGLDCKTDYNNMLTLFALKERFRYRVVLPTAEPLTVFAIPDTDEKLIVCSDCAVFGKNALVLPDAYHVLFRGEVNFECIDEAMYHVEKAGEMTLFGVKNFFNAELLKTDFDALLAKKLEFTEEIPDFGAADSDTCTTIGRAWSQLRGHIYSAEGIYPGYFATPDRWPHRACWIMDSVYQALAVRYFKKDVATDMVTALLNQQREDGLIVQSSTPEFTKRNITQQPIIAWGLEKCDPSVETVAKAYMHLAGYLEWNMRHRDFTGVGLLSWMFSSSPHDCACGESGMDNSPRFDCGCAQYAVDLNCFMSKECEVMAKFAEMLNLPAEAEYWQEQHERFNDLIEEYFWNEEKQFYTDFDLMHYWKSPVMAVSGFMPLFCGAASKEHAAAIAAHVRNKETFGTKYPLPSVSLSDPAFELDMWRGPVWHIFNYIAAEGLEHYGYCDEADHIRRQTVEMQIKNYREFGGFYEFFDPAGVVPPGKINRKGPNVPEGLSTLHRAVHDYGWSASIFLDMLAKLNKKCGNI